MQVTIERYVANESASRQHVALPVKAWILIRRDDAANIKPTKQSQDFLNVALKSALKVHIQAGKIRGLWAAIQIGTLG